MYRELNLSTKKGQRIYDMGCHCCWRSLHNLYDRWSDAKQKAFDWCWEMYCQCVDATSFGIGNANSFGFTASWFCKVNGEDVMRVETKDNTYIVYLNR